MRPVNRGSWPQDENGNNVAYSAYGNARGMLIKNMGQYCSYCEQKLGASLAVEHVLPKDLYPTLKLSWDNFILGCTNCNSTKGAKNPGLNNIYWPHIDNTYRAFTYHAGGRIKVNSALNTSQQSQAKKTLKLTGLKKRKPVNGSASDRRWINRRSVMEQAKTLLDDYKNNPSEAQLRAIKIVAINAGFWSVWMTIFQNYPDVQREISEAFPGTCMGCFDDNMNPIQRNPTGI